MSFIPSLAAPIGRLYSTTSDTLVKLGTREDALRHRIQNQIISLVSTVETLHSTRNLRTRILDLQTRQTALKTKLEDISRAISHKAFLFPEETPLQEQNQSARVRLQLKEVNKQLAKLCAHKH